MQLTQAHTEPQRSPLLLLDRTEAADSLRISVRKLDALIERREIAPVRIDGRVLVAWSELCRFVQERQAVSA